ncbi:MAG: hypothetical protein WBA87_03340 [Microbacterium sp.]
MHARSHMRARRRAAVIEPYVMQRLHTVELLREKAGLEVVHSGDSITSLLTWMRGQDRSNWPHLLVVEMLTAPVGDHIVTAVAMLRDAGMRVLLLSSLTPRRAAQRVADEGVDGIVSKLDSEQTVLASVAAVLAGEPAVTERARDALAGDSSAPGLSTQESRVLELYVAGNPIAVVAEEIGVREDTARKYLARIKQKYAALGRVARTKLDLARLAREDGLVDL